MKVHKNHSRIAAPYLTNYIPQLTFPRFLAASLVVVFHYGSSTFPFNTGLISKFVAQGSIAVSFFFFLSGLVLTINYFRGPGFTFGSFFRKRIARIYPIYVFAFLITFFLAMLIKGAYPRGTSIFIQLFSLHAWSPGMCLEINYPGWSISVEMFFYAVFPVLIFFFRKKNLLFITIFTGLIWLFSILQNYYLAKLIEDPDIIATGEFILYFPLWHLNTFLFGMLSGILILNYKHKIISKFLPVCLFLAGSVTFIIILVTDNPFRPYIHNGLLSPVYMMLAVGLALDSSWIARLMGIRELVYLGDISYSIYILQFPVYLLFIWILKIENVNGVYFYAYFTVLLLVSAATYKLIEQKFRKLLISVRNKS